MKRTWPILLGFLLLALPVVVQAQSGSGDNFDYTINPNDTNTITICHYTGTDTFVTIPTYINNLLVTGIGYTNVDGSVFPGGTTGVAIPDSVTSIGNAFLGGIFTNITIPDSVTNIGDLAFFYCLSLTAINVDAQNAYYSSTNGVLFDKRQNTLIQFPAGLGGSYSIPGTVTCIGEDAFDPGPNLTSVTLPHGVTNIEVDAFASCGKLTSITIPNGVANIGEYAFYACFDLTNVYFTGNAPNANTTVFAAVDVYGNNATAYYLPGTTGWSNTFAGLPAVLWNPIIQTSGAAFGVRSNQFGFTITNGTTTNIPLVVEACTNLATPVWIPVQSLVLTNTFYFTDPQWTNDPARYYGLGFP